jgi:hypothetical protein
MDTKIEKIKQSMDWADAQGLIHPPFSADNMRIALATLAERDGQIAELKADPSKQINFEQNEIKYEEQIAALKAENSEIKNVLKSIVALVIWAQKWHLPFSIEINEATTGKEAKDE